MKELPISVTRIILFEQQLSAAAGVSLFKQ
jgi:hypothetical protein